jgi:hypothetical protein
MGVGYLGRAGYEAVTGLGGTTGPTTSVNGGTYNMLPGDTAIRVNLAPQTINLAGAAAGVQDGQHVLIINFDTGNGPVVLVPHAGDDIVGGPSFNLAFYDDVIVLQARIAAGVVHWIIASSSSFTQLQFPLQPTLAAGAQGPISLGYILLPAAVRYLHSVYYAHDAALAAGQSTVILHGLATDPSPFTCTAPAQASGNIFPPGSGPRLTTQNVGTGLGCLIQATVTTNAAFSGPTTVVCTLRAW